MEFCGRKQDVYAACITISYWFKVVKLVVSASSYLKKMAEVSPSCEEPQKKSLLPNGSSRVTLFKS